MKQPTFDGLAASKMLYGDADNAKSKVSTPPENNNLYGRPSIIPEVEYPISEHEEQLLDKAWQHACNLKSRGLL